MKALDGGPILALDLATIFCGWCFYAGQHDWRAGTWRLTPGGQQERLVRLGAVLHGVLRDERPALVVAEVPDHARYSVANTPNTLRALASAWGVVIEACRACGIPSRDWTPQLVRERLCGRETADKAYAQWCLIQRGYHLPRLANGQVDHDAADALALACVAYDDMTSPIGTMRARGGTR